LVDEAHQLTSELLEEIRLLTNIETSQQKLLQIVLVGQPELDDVLDSVELRQLKQRVALRCRLNPLDEADVHGYIVRRLQLAGAGARAEQIFPEAALKRILHHSRGIPRLINAICDSALVNGYARRESAIEPDEIEEVVNDLRLEVVPEGRGDSGNPVQGERAMLIRSLMRIAELLDPEPNHGAKKNGRPAERVQVAAQRAGVR
jgi:general secretion pathway protein A